MIYPEFKDKVIMVTGAAGGIGSKLVERFEACGAVVYGTDIVESKQQHFIRGDISDTAFQKSWLKDVLEKEGRVDVLINNAGVCPRTALSDITEDEWRRVIDINLTATFFLSQICIEQMISQKSGVIINLASLAGKVGGIAVGAHYSASKAAIACLTKTLARSGAGHGVRVNAVAPGVIDTDITSAATPQQREAFKTTIPMGRIGDADEVVRPIMFLVSAEASYITGATLDINGGLLMD